MAIKTCLNEINSGLITVRPTGSNAAFVTRSAGRREGVGMVWVVGLMGVAVVSGLLTIVM